MTTVFTVQFNLQSKPPTQKIQIAKTRHNQNGGGQSTCNDFSCDYSRHMFAKEKEFYSGNETYVLTNEVDATKCQSNNETTFSDSG